LFPPARPSRSKRKLKQLGKQVETVVYPGAPHGFFNDSRSTQYPKGGRGPTPGSGRSRSSARREVGAGSMATEASRTVCNRDCPDACGLIATVEDGRLVKLGGDPDHPVTKGFICYRTSLYPETQNSPRASRAR